MRHPEEFSDTDPQAMEAWIELIRSKTPGERLAMTLELIDAAWRPREASIRAEHPEASDQEVRGRLAATHLPSELVKKAYGWDPDTQSFLDQAPPTIVEGAKKDAG